VVLKEQRQEQGQQQEEHSPLNNEHERTSSSSLTPGIKRQSPTIYRVTTGSLSETTKQTYQCHINDFLAYYKITDLSGIEPLKEYSPKLIRQMVLDYVLYLRDKKPGR